MTATGSRILHVDSDVETTLAALEEAELVVVSCLVPAGPDARTFGWFRVHCPRGCHGSVNLPNKILTPIVKQEFHQWVSTVLTDHDQADMGES